MGARIAEKLWRLPEGTKISFTVSKDGDKMEKVKATWLNNTKHDGIHFKAKVRIYRRKTSSWITLDDRVKEVTVGW